MKKVEKRFAICFPSGTVLFWTDDKVVADNRAKMGWTVKDVSPS